MSIGITPQSDKLFVYNASGTNTGLTIQQDGTGDIFRANGNSGANRFSITQSGAATFSSSITATTAVFSGYAINANPTSASTGATFTRYLNTGGDFYMGLENSSSSFFGASAYANVMYMGSTNLEMFWSGSRKVTFTSGGSVGIGTSSPYALLTVYSGSAGDRILIDSANGSGSNGAIAWGAGGVPNISARIRGIDDGFYGTHLLFETRGQSGPATNTIERVRISSGGIVTRPYQPFVIGGLDGNQSISSNTFTTLNFSTTVGMFYYANVGNCWNNSTRAFTAPVTGVYMVNVSLMTDSVGQVALHVNGARRHSIPAPPFTTGITWGGTAMIPLTAGESLTLQGYGNAGSVTQNQFHTFFSIYLL
jgi:hypothetical protein